MTPHDPSADQVISLYQRHAEHFDEDRTRHLQEAAWLADFLGMMPDAGAVLDLGCGMGEPIAQHLIARGCHLTGLDTSPALIALCRQRFPTHEWSVGDMRLASWPRTFDGVLAWDSFFHLTPTAQRAMVPRFAALARAGAPLLFTSGPDGGELVGSYRGEPLYHASLSPYEYASLLAEHGFTVVRHVANDPGCGGHTVWLCRRLADRPA